MIGAATENGTLRIFGKVAIPNAPGGQWSPERITKLLDTIQQTVEAAEFVDRETRGLPPVVSSAPARKPPGLFGVFFDGETRPVAGFVLEQDAHRYAKMYCDPAGTFEIRHINVVEGGQHDRQKGDEEVAPSLTPTRQ